MRWWYFATMLGLVGHHVFEFIAGVGLVWQPELGLAGAAAFWVLLISALVVIATLDGAVASAALAVFAGISVASVLVHYLLWPWRWRAGLPWLTEAEGMRAHLLSAYNVVLYAWLAAGIGALVFDTPVRALPWALAGLATMPLLRSSARAHFRWLQRQPLAWWNARSRR